MADFEKKVALIQVDIDSSDAEKEVEKLSELILNQKKAISDNNAGIKDLNKSTSELTKGVKEGTISYEESSKAIDDNEKEVRELQKANLKLKDELKDLNKERANAVKISKLSANSLDALRAVTANQKKELNGLNTATEEGADRFNELTEELKKNNDAIVNADQSAGDFKTTIGRYNEEVGKAISRTKVQIAGFDKLIDSFGDLKKGSKEQVQAFKALKTQSDSVKQSITSLDRSTEEGEAAFKEMTKEIARMDEQLSEARKEVGSVALAVDKLSEGTDKAADSFDEMSSAVDESGNSVIKLGKDILKVFKLILTNPVGLLVAALGALVAAFSKTERGALAFEKASAFLSGALSELIGLVDDLASFLIKAFEDPEQAIKDLGNFLVENLTNRLTAIIDTVVALGGVISNLVKGEFDELGKSAKDVGLALVQFQTGIDSKTLDDFGKQIIDTANKMAALAERQREVNKLNRETRLEIVKTGAEEERLIQIREDDTRSFEEREEAGKKVFALTKKRAEEEITIAVRNQQLLKEEIALRQANGENVEQLLDEKLEADVAVLESQKELTLKILENDEKQAMLRRDIFEQDLDFAIDVGTRRTEEALRAAENEKLSLEEREAALQKARALDEEAFNNQLNLFEEIGLSRQKINELVNESNAAVINSELKKTQLNEIERNRFRELVLERQGLIEGLRDTENSIDEARAEAAVSRLDNEKELSQKLFDINEARIEGENQLALSKAENEEERFELELEQLEERFERKEELLQEQRDLALENEALTEEERTNILLDFELERQGLLNELDSKKIDARKKSAEEEIKLEEKKQKKLGELLDQGVQAAQSLSDTAFQNKQTKLETQRVKELEDLKAQLDEGLITEEEFNEKEEKINRDSAKKAHEIEVKQFKANKAISLVEIAINTARGISNALGSFPPPASFAFAAIVGALGVAQGIAVGAQKPPPPPSFAKGGDVFGFTVGGNYHNQGGTRYTGEDGNSFEVEKDEGIFVTKRDATNPALRLLSETNEKHGGRSMFSAPKPFLQEGGSAGGGMNTNQLAAIIDTTVAATVSSLPPAQVQVVDIMGGIEGNQEAESVGVV